MIDVVHTYANTHVVLLAVFLLGGDKMPIDIEDIAVKAFELAPARFCWKKYPDRIDIRIVTYAMKDAMRLSPRVFIGSLKHGYMVTIEGIALLQQLHIINSQIEIAKDNRADTAEAIRSIELDRLLRSSAFHKFQSELTDTITKQDFYEFARINDYFPAHIRDLRFEQLKRTIKGNSDLEELWSLMCSKYLP